MSKRTLPEFHRAMQQFPKIAVSILHPLNHLQMDDNHFNELLAKFRDLFEKGCDVLDWYQSRHTSVDDHGWSDVRVEYCFAYDLTDHEEELEIVLPISDDQETSPLDLILCAQFESVHNDIKKTNDQIIAPLKAACQMNREDIMKYTPEMKTALVYYAEKFQQKVNSTHPGFFGVHKTLIDQGKVTDYGRATIPFEYKHGLSRELKAISALTFGVDPNLLPLCHKFDDMYQPIPGCKTSSTSSLTADQEDKLRKYTDTTMLKKVFKMLAAFMSHIFFGMRPNTTITCGLMENINYKNWLDRTVEEKLETMRRLAFWFVLIYHYEIQVMITKRFKNASKTNEKNKKCYDLLMEHQSDKNNPPMFVVARDVIDFERAAAKQTIVNQMERATEVNRLGKCTGSLPGIQFQKKY